MAAPFSPARDQLRALSRRRPGRFTLLLAADWIAVWAALAAAHAIDRWWGYVAAVFVLGNRQHALGVLGHDLAHHLGYRQAPVNRIIGELACFLPLFGSFAGYQRFHVRHHRLFGTAEDPEVTAGLRTQGKPLDRGAMIRACLLDLFGSGIPMSLNIYRHMVDARAIRMLVAYWAVTVACVAWFGAWTSLALWLAALMTTFPAVMRVRSALEHAGATGAVRHPHGRVFALVFRPHNVGFHDEHHRWPGIPCFRLPESHRLQVATAIGSTRVERVTEGARPGSADPLRVAESGTPPVGPSPISAVPSRTGWPSAEPHELPFHAPARAP